MDGTTDPADRRPDVTLVLDTVRDLMAELRHGAPAVPVALESRLDADLGLDSLALVELRARLEESGHLTLPDRVLDCPTPQGWVDAVHTAPRTPGAALVTRPRPRPRPSPAEAGQPAQAETMLDVLSWHLARQPDRVHVRLLHDAERPERPSDDGKGHPPDDADLDRSEGQVLTYAQLHERSARVAAGLQDHGIGPADAVAIMLPTGADYFAVFVGILMAGAIPVPIYPPARRQGLEDHLQRQVRILRTAGTKLLVTVPEARLLSRLVQPQVPSLDAITAADELSGGRSTPHRVTPRPDDIALVQYTSGSTGNPKGVVLAHAHMLANIRAICAAVDPRPDDVVVSWLPLYHDMGLIGSWLTSLYLGLELEVMPPTAFLARPVRWLRAISDYRGTLSPSPNFGYELCLRHVRDEELADLDLSAWRMALSGAEPVSPDTIRRFTDRFAACGFAPEALTPVYGLAEAGLAVTFPPLGRGPLIDAVDRQVLTRSGRAVPAETGDPAPARFTACGHPLPGYQVRVVDSAGEELGDRHEGRIEFSGPSATPGYFHNEPATRSLRRDGWLDTGDLGYVADGDLYVTGRSKDIIIRAGRNLHPEELEEAVGNLPGVRKGCVAAFGAPDPVQGTERLVVLAETHLTDAGPRADLRQRIMAVTVDLLDTPPDDVVMAPPGTVLKTSSGKIRRAACRELYEAGTLGERRRDTRWQLARFALRSTRPQLRRVARTGGTLLYAAYAWAVVLVLGVPVWLAVTLAPTLTLRWRILRAAGAGAARACGIRFEVTGSWPADGAYVVVANHASFVDGLAMVLASPWPLAFVAGGELARQRVAGPFLRRLGCVFVNEGTMQVRREEAAGIAATLRSGRRFAFFPEGSITRAPGLRSFHLGAFTTATDAGVPIVPVGIRGSRDVVRPGGRLPRHGAVRVAVGDPIAPAGRGWAATLALRDQARTAILTLSGEPDLE